MKAFLPLLLVVGLNLQAQGFRAVFFDIMKYMDCNDRIDPTPEEIKTILHDCTQQFDISVPDNVTTVLFSGYIDNDESNDIGDYTSYEDYGDGHVVYEIVGKFLEELYVKDKEAAGNLMACSLQYKATHLMKDPDLQKADLLQCTPNFVHGPKHMDTIVDCLRSSCVYAI